MTNNVYANQADALEMARTPRCEAEGCAELVCFEIWDDDGPVRGECEQHAIATVENSNGELRLKDPR